MISFDDALQILLGWKANNSELYSHQCTSEGERIPLGTLIVVDASRDELILTGFVRTFSFRLMDAEFSDGTGENDTQVNTTISRQVLDICLGDGTHLTLMGPK